MNNPLNTDCSSFRFIAAKFAPTAAALAFLAFSLTGHSQDAAPAGLPSPLCDSLQIPGGNSLTFHAYAVGVQIYQWNGANWVFVAPSATLYADPGYHARVAIHYAGPTWQSISGSKVVGTKLATCTPDTTAIPWLKLGAISSQGPGVFDGVSFVQRVNTVGGIAPATAGTSVGQMANVPYSAEYYFYSPAE